MDQYTCQHYDERCRDKLESLMFFRKHFIPQYLDEYRHNTYDQCERNSIPYRMNDFSECIFTIFLLKSFIALEIKIVSHEMRNLLEYQDQPDRRKHTLDHAVRNIIPNDARFDKAENELDNSSKHHCQQKYFIYLQPAYCCSYNCR